MGRNEWTDEKLFYRLINNKSDKGYWDSIQVLRKRPTEAVYNRCMELTRSERAKEREIGLYVLAQLGGRERPFLKGSVRRYFELLATEQELPMINCVLSAISHNHDKLTKVQIGKLCALGNKPAPKIKWNLVLALSTLEAPRAIDVLIKLSSDKSVVVRDWATFGLGSQIDTNNEEIVAALWQRVDDKDEDTRFEAIVGLAIRKDARVKGLIERELARDHGAQLFEAIIELGDKSFLPRLRKLLKAMRKETDISADWLSSLEHCIKALVTGQNW